MSEAKIEVNLGNVSFSGTGEQEWLSEQLDKILRAAPELSKIDPLTAVHREDPSRDEPVATKAEFSTSLVSHIRANGGESSQVQRFLATADWLRRRGNSPLTTSAVSKALQDNHQKKLSNPADCLNRNVTKGHCEKSSDGFFITPDGLKLLGE